MTSPSASQSSDNREDSPASLNSRSTQESEASSTPNWVAYGSEDESSLVFSVCDFPAPPTHKGPAPRISGTQAGSSPQESVVSWTPNWVAYATDDDDCESAASGTARSPPFELPTPPSSYATAPATPATVCRHATKGPRATIRQVCEPVLNILERGNRGSQPKSESWTRCLLRAFQERPMTPVIGAYDPIWDAPLPERLPGDGRGGTWYEVPGHRVAHLDSPCPRGRAPRLTIEPPQQLPSLPAERPNHTRPRATRLPQPTFSLGRGRNRPGFKETGQKKMVIKPSRIPKRVF